MDGDFVEPPQSFRLRYAVLDHHGVEVFHVRHADQLIDVGIVSLVAFEVWMRELPLLVRLPEKRNIQHVRLVRVDDAHLGARNRRRNEVLLNRVRVDTIVDFRQFALGQYPKRSRPPSPKLRKESSNENVRITAENHHRNLHQGVSP